MKEFLIRYERIDAGFKLPNGMVTHKAMSAESMLHIISMWNGHQNHTIYSLQSEILA